MIEKDRTCYKYIKHPNKFASGLSYGQPLFKTTYVSPVCVESLNADHLDPVQPRRKTIID